LMKYLGIFWTIFIYFLINRTYAQLICNNKSITVYVIDGGILTYDTLHPSFTLNYEGDSFYVECDFESIGEVDSEQFNDIFSYDLQSANFTINCTDVIPNYYDPINNSSNSTFDSLYETHILTMTTTLPNNATVEIRFTLFPLNWTNPIILDKDTVLNLNGGSFLMETTISNWNHSQSNSRVKLVARLKTNASILSLYAGYYSDTGYLNTVEVSGAVNNIELIVSEETNISQFGSSHSESVTLDTNVQGISPPTGILNIIFPDFTKNDTAQYAAVVQFKVYETPKYYVIVVVVSISVSVCCLCICLGIFIFCLLKKYPELRLTGGDPQRLSKSEKSDTDMEMVTQDSGSHSDPEELPTLGNNEE